MMCHHGIGGGGGWLKREWNNAGPADQSKDSDVDLRGGSLSYEILECNLVVLICSSVSPLKNFLVALAYTCF